MPQRIVPMPGGLLPLLTWDRAFGRRVPKQVPEVKRRGASSPWRKTGLPLYREMGVFVLSGRRLPDLNELGNRIDVEDLDDGFSRQARTVQAAPRKMRWRR
jgi:hypothetical protein